MEWAGAELAAIPALQDAFPLHAGGPECCRRGPVSRGPSLQRYRTETRKGPQNKPSVVDAYCDSFHLLQFVAERRNGHMVISSGALFLWPRESCAGLLRGKYQKRRPYGKVALNAPTPQFQANGAGQARCQASPAPAG